MAALGELSFGVALASNNTLTGILGRAQLLLRTTRRGKINAGIEMIVKSAEDGAHYTAHSGLRAQTTKSQV